MKSTLKHTEQGETTNRIQQFFNLGNVLIALSSGAILLAILLAYFLHHQLHLTITEQVIAHLVIIVAPGVIKVGYVMRLAAEHAFTFNS